MIWIVKYIVNGKRCFQTVESSTESGAVKIVKDSLPAGSLEFKLHSILHKPEKVNDLKEKLDDSNVVDRLKSIFNLK